MGVAVGDMDNDGDVDVYVTNFGPDRLFRNEGNGRFADVSEASGIRGDEWSMSAAFFDYDRDGWLDLYVTHYVALDTSIRGRDRAGRPDYPGPQMFEGVPDRLYRNEGGGRFADVTEEAGIGGRGLRGLGVGVADFDRNGWLDVYVANDGQENQLWMNTGNGRFEDRAAVLGASVNGFGKPEASMGVAVGDVDGDLDLDVFLTHLVLESNTLYMNDGDGAFFDRTVACGLSGPSMDFTGFGTVFLDVEHDGDLDLAVVNGRVRRDSPAEGADFDGLGHWRDYAERDLFFENDGRGRFEIACNRAGAFCKPVDVGRGLVAGDVDGDGDLDLLETNDGGRARLFRNDGRKAGAWLMIRVLDAVHHRDAIGAEVTVRAGGRRYRRDVNRGFSYLCSGDATVHFGLGEVERYEEIEVHMPDLGVRRFGGGAVNRLVELRIE